MRLELGRPVNCTDGPFGKLADVVIDPTKRRVMYLVVEPHDDHGKARHVAITLAKPRDRVQLAIKDDGIGLPQAARKSRGMGLRIMEYRAGLIGGSLAIERQAGGGTCVTCAMPAQDDHLSTRG